MPGPRIGEPHGLSAPKRTRVASRARHLLDGLARLEEVPPLEVLLHHTLGGEKLVDEALILLLVEGGR